MIRLLALFALLLAATTARAQSTIALRPWAKATPGAAVRMADIADLTGPEAQALANVVVATSEDLSRSARIDLAQVRRAAETHARVNLGRISFSGSTCMVRVIAAEPAAPPSSTPATTAAPRADAVRHHVATRIAQFLGVEESDLRLTFEDGADLLNSPASGRTVAVQPAALSDRMPINVRVYRADVLEAEGVVRVGVLVRRQVLIARDALSRADSIDMERIDQQEQWLGPSVIPARREQVLGAVARTRVEPGRVILARDVEAPIVIARGDLVSIDCISGSVVVSTTARAKEPGREGDVIQFQSLSSKKTFAAKVSGRGRAVLVADEARAGL